MAERAEIAFQLRFHRRIIRQSDLHVSGRRFRVDGAAVRRCHGKHDIAVKALNVNGFTRSAQINQAVDRFRFNRAALMSGQLDLSVSRFRRRLSAVK